MSLATTVTPAITRTPRFERIRSLRWDHWEAALMLWAEQQPPSAHVSLASRQEFHAEWLASLLARGISINVIRRCAMDDPRESRTTLQQRADIYLSRRMKRNLTNVTNK